MKPLNIERHFTKHGRRCEVQCRQSSAHPNERCMPSVMSHGVLQTMGDFYSKCYDAHIDGYQNAYKKRKSRNEYCAAHNWSSETREEL